MRFLSRGLILLVASTSIGAQTPNRVSATGFLTDTLCGKRGATAQHVDHAKRSVASGKAKYAIYDEKTRQLYILDPQQTAEAYLGQRVTITGTLTPAAERRAGEKAVQTRAGDPSSVTVERHSPRAGRPLDTSTPVAGVLAVTSIEAAPTRRQ